MDFETADARTRVLDAAAELFYAHGIKAVGIDRIRDASGVSLRSLYQHFPSKDALVDSYLDRVDQRGRADLEEYVAAHATAKGQLLAVFDWLYAWFSQPGFRGCAFVNALGEHGADSTTVTDAARAHKSAVRHYLLGLVQATAAADTSSLADQLVILFEGAITIAAVTGTPEPALHARAAAEALLAAAEA